MPASVDHPARSLWRAMSPAPRAEAKAGQSPLHGRVEPPLAEVDVPGKVRDAQVSPPREKPNQGPGAGGQGRQGQGIVDTSLQEPRQADLLEVVRDGIEPVALELQVEEVRRTLSERFELPQWPLRIVARRRAASRPDVCSRR